MVIKIVSFTLFNWNYYNCCCCCCYWFRSPGAKQDDFRSGQNGHRLNGRSDRSGLKWWTWAFPAPRASSFLASFVGKGKSNYIHISDIFCLFWCAHRETHSLESTHKTNRSNPSTTWGELSDTERHAWFSATARSLSMSNYDYEGKKLNQNKRTWKAQCVKRIIMISKR